MSQIKMIQGTDKEIAAQLGTISQFFLNEISYQASVDQIFKDIERSSFVKMTENDVQNFFNTWTTGQVENYIQGQVDSRVLAESLAAQFFLEEASQKNNNQDYNDVQEKISINFSYFNDNNQPCALSFTYFCQTTTSPARWIASITHNANQNTDQRNTLLMGHEDFFKESETISLEQEIGSLIEPNQVHSKFLDQIQSAEIQDLIKKFFINESTINEKTLKNLSQIIKPQSIFDLKDVNNDGLLTKKSDKIDYFYFKKKNNIFNALKNKFQHFIEHDVDQNKTELLELQGKLDKSKNELKEKINDLNFLKIKNRMQQKRLNQSDVPASYQNLTSEKEIITLFTADRATALNKIHKKYLFKRRLNAAFFILSIIAVTILTLALVGILGPIGIFFAPIIAGITITGLTATGFLTKGIIDEVNYTKELNKTDQQFSQNSELAQKLNREIEILKATAVIIAMKNLIHELAIQLQKLQEKNEIRLMPDAMNAVFRNACKPLMNQDFNAGKCSFITKTKEDFEQLKYKNSFKNSCYIYIKPIDDKKAELYYFNVETQKFYSVENLKNSFCHSALINAFKEKQLIKEDNDDIDIQELSPEQLDLIETHVQHTHCDTLIKAFEDNLEREMQNIVVTPITINKKSEETQDFDELMIELDYSQNTIHKLTQSGNEIHFNPPPVTENKKSEHENKKEEVNLNNTRDSDIKNN